MRILIERLMISYPVPFDGAPIGTLRLPKDLTQEEADRVKAMIDSLVTERGQARGGIAPDYADSAE